MLIIFASATARNVEYLSNWSFPRKHSDAQNEATEERF